MIRQSPEVRHPDRELPRTEWHDHRSVRSRTPATRPAGPDRPDPGAQPAGSASRAAASLIASGVPASLTEAIPLRSAAARPERGRAGDHVQGASRLPASPGDLPDELSLEALLIEAALARDHGVRLVQPRVEADHAEHEGRSGDEPGAEDGPEPAGEATGGAGHRSPTRIPRESAGEGDHAGAQARDLIGGRPLLGRELLGGALERHGGVAEDLQGRVPRSLGLLKRLDRAAPAVHRRGAAGGDQDAPGAGFDRGRYQLARSRAASRLGIALILRNEGEARRGRRLDDRGGAIAHERESRLNRPSERIVDLGRSPLAPHGSEQHLRGALPAVGRRAELGPGAGSLDSTADRLSDLLRAERPLERIRSD